MSSARARPSSQLPKAPTLIAPNCVIADTAVLTGIHLITISANAILHPRARINSTYGPVTLGEGCIISEKTTIGLLSPTEEERPAGTVLEKDVVVEPTVVVEGRTIGQGTTLEAGSKVGAGAVMGKYCKVGPLCTVAPQETLDDFTIVYGDNLRRKEKPGLESYRKISHDKEVELLRKMIPTNLAKWQSPVR